MKKTAIIFLIITALSIITTPVRADDFATWCDTFTAQGLISLTANRIYGSPLSLDDAAYKDRSRWVSAAYEQSERRYKDLTGKTYDDFGKTGWIAQCQTKNQSFCR